MRWIVALFVVCGLILGPGTANAADAWGPLAPPNPFLGPPGTATTHGDAGSSDATPLAGPGTHPVAAAGYPLASACPTILQGKDELVVALCTSIIDQDPTVFLIEPRGLVPESFPLASLRLANGGPPGGAYAYLDNNDRLVVIDGNRNLLRIGHTKDGHGAWKLSVEEPTDLSAAIPADDNPVGLVPDRQGNVWFATAKGRVGVVKAGYGAMKILQLPAGEQVANGISSAPGGRVAVASTHALYELTADGAGAPQLLWRADYDRGSARKPGQLSWGTGSTPTYFGSSDGADYLTIVDNADEEVRLLVYRSGSGQLVCSQPVLTQGGPGTENSPIGIGRSVIVTSTYGYPYPTTSPDGSEVPATAPFEGGMTRVDVDDGGCHTVWDNDVRSATAPHLSTGDGNIYSITRSGPAETTPRDAYNYAVVDPDTGAIKTEQLLSGAIVADTLQTSPLITKDGKVMQGTISGIMRISSSSVR